jgi:1-deoxy-D-xylulose-5-phosphate synthase
MSGQFYSTAKHTAKKVLEHVPPLFEFAKRFEGHAKGMIVPATIFQEFGFNYIGPIDGHDLESLLPTLANIKKLAEETGQPQFLHVVTRKGQGYKLAEADPVKYHGPTPFDPSKGIQPSTATPKKSYTQVFGEWLCDQAAADERLVGITPAMREGSGLVEFEKKFPKRYFDVGIAEQHAVTFAAGLACEGKKPVVAIYSTFLQRGYDQLIHDVALQNLDVTFALDRAGLVGSDGATHAGNYDIAYLRCIPNMAVLAASDEEECRKMLSTAFAHRGPAAVRYPRGAGPGVQTQSNLDTLPWGKGEIRRAGKRIAILAFGSMVAPSLVAGEKLGATVANMRFVKPLDDALVLELAASHDVLVTVEEGAVMGGAGSAVTECLNAHGIAKEVLQLGLPDLFIDHGDPAKLLAMQGLDAAGIEASINKRFAKLIPAAPRLVA